MIDKQFKTIKDNSSIEELDFLTTFKGIGMRQTSNACAIDTLRRYQKLDDLAPVSRRQYRKRKAQLLPQDVNMTS